MTFTSSVVPEIEGERIPHCDTRVVGTICRIISEQQPKAEKKSVEHVWLLQIIDTKLHNHLAIELLFPFSYTNIEGILSWILLDIFSFWKWFKNNLIPRYCPVAHGKRRITLYIGVFFRSKDYTNTKEKNYCREKIEKFQSESLSESSIFTNTAIRCSQSNEK